MTELRNWRGLDVRGITGGRETGRARRESGSDSDIQTFTRPRVLLLVDEALLAGTAVEGSLK